MTDARLILDPPQSGMWNMAADEALLESAATSGVTTLRFYTWEEPTLSLGYFQRLADRDGHQPSRQCALVRRCSGGGAILHDKELTYSFAAPMQAGRSAEAVAFYRAFHDTLIDQLIDSGIPARRCESPPMIAPGDQPFLCFQRRTAGDVLLGDAKIVGSAQRRRLGAVLQHGSIILETSPFAPELPGIETLSGKQIDVQELIERWTERLSVRLKLQFVAGTLTDEETRRAQSHAADRFATKQWTARR